MIDTRDTGTDRGQAYTLEGFIGAMVVLMAVLFALQSVVVTPTTGGLSDRSVQSQLQQEAQDALVVASQDGNLSETVRNWENETNEMNESRFYNATEPGPDGQPTYSPGELANQSVLGEILYARFTERGWSYNVELVYDESDEFNSTMMVYQGSPPSDAITASYTVTLYESDHLTAANNTEQNIQLRDAHDDEGYPIPPATNSGDPVYTVVEVRVMIW